MRLSPAASEHPYRSTSRAGTRAASAAGSASPLLIQVVTDGGSPFSANAASRLGTSVTSPAPCRSMNPASATASAAVASSAMTTVSPAARPPSSSVVPSMNAGDDFATRTPGAARSAPQASRLARARWVPTTAFGVPVDPDVKIT
ncbi:Uncharacterised protein [Mycobacterium tuberculosis]|nr:Uncharacterised protein [Mycobacterium tuberculosis]